ncbi:unnamed protein product [Orchesella dallaii]|uniref:Serine-threonine/tyrosine-protein kinase catalytic domain-containing protein n=1 Tax=Orchesella dallaii TaxID=48710 RepID=A0ABP1RB57_9HEXA
MVLYFKGEIVLFPVPGDPNSEKSRQHHFKSCGKETCFILAQRRSYNVSCIMKNFKGEFQQSIVKYEDSTPSTLEPGYLLIAIELCTNGSLENHLRSSVPYGGSNWTPELANELQKGLRLSIPEFSPKNIYDNILKCWDINPDGRPTFSEMMEIIKPFLNVEYLELT